jgi:hypothetical protein
VGPDGVGPDGVGPERVLSRGRAVHVALHIEAGGHCATGLRCRGHKPRHLLVGQAAVSVGPRLDGDDEVRLHGVGGALMRTRAG